MFQNKARLLRNHQSMYVFVRGKHFMAILFIGASIRLIAIALSLVTSYRILIIVSLRERKLNVFFLTG